MNETIPAAQIAGFSSKTANLAGVRLHYLLSGNPSGPPVLLWHGFLSTSQEWREVMPGLAEAGYSVLVPDMRGYGDSDKPEGTTCCRTGCRRSARRALWHWWRPCRQSLRPSLFELEKPSTRILNHVRPEIP